MLPCFKSFNSFQLKNIIFIISIALIVSCGGNSGPGKLHTIVAKDSIHQHPISVSLDIVGAGYENYYSAQYEPGGNQNNQAQGDSIPILFVDIGVNNLSNDTLDLVFMYTSFFKQFLFEPSSISTFGFCCDKNSLEKMFFLPHGKIVFHTMINDLRNAGNPSTDRIRVGFVMIDSLAFHLRDFENEMNEKKKNENDVYWSNYIRINRAIPLANLYHKYDYGFSIVDSTGKILFTSRPLPSS